MKVRATVDASAITIVIVNADVKRGEKVFNAYILSSIRFNCCLWVGSARLFSFCSSVVNCNEWGIASSRYERTIGAKKKGVKFFFNFFFVGCGARGCGAWVWGCVGVERRDRDGAGWMEAG